MPLTAAPIACSRTPQWTLAPHDDAANEPAPGSTVLVDSTRSAEPPTIVGANGANAAIALPPAARVASFARLPRSNRGSDAATPGSGLPDQARAHSAARSG